MRHEQSHFINSAWSGAVPRPPPGEIISADPLKKRGYAELHQQCREPITLYTAGTQYPPAVYNVNGCLSC